MHGASKLNRQHIPSLKSQIREPTEENQLSKVALRHQCRHQFVLIAQWHVKATAVKMKSLPGILPVYKLMRAVSDMEFTSGISQKRHEGNPKRASTG